MNFKSSRNEAVKELNQFIENNLLEYPKLRNFDLGLKEEIILLVYHLMLPMV